MALGATIAQSCALARALEQRIRQAPELELLAPAQLNIVCFRCGAGFNTRSLRLVNW